VDGARYILILSKKSMLNWFLNVLYRNLLKSLEVNCCFCATLILSLRTSWAAAIVEFVKKSVIVKCFFPLSNFIGVEKVKEIFLVFHSFWYLENFKIICFLYNIIENYRRRRSNQNHITIKANSKRHDNFIVLFYFEKLAKFNDKKMKNTPHFTTIFHYHKELKRIVVKNCCFEIFKTLK